MSHARETKGRSAVARLFHQQRRRRRQEAAGQQINRHAVPVAAGEGHQRGGNKRRKPAADHACHLIAHARAAVAVACAKQLGEHRLLHAHHHIVRDVGEHDGEEDNPEDRLRLERHKEWPGAEGANQRPGNVNATAAKPVRQPGEAGDSQAADPADEQANIEEQLARQTEILRRVVQRERGDDIHRQQLAQAQGDNFQKSARVLNQRFHHRQTLFGERFFQLLFFKLCRLLHPVTDPQRCNDQHDAEDERNAPAPAQELLVGGELADERYQPGGKQQAYAVPDLHAAAVKGFPVLRRALNGQQRRAAPFAADGEALDGAQGDQQYRRPPADRGKRGENTDKRGGDPHHPDGEHQHALAAQAIAEVAEDHPAQRAKQKADAEGGKRGERAHRGADLGKKLAVEHQRGSNAVKQKIIPVDDGTREAA
ncbi:hypothetical protein L1887_46261 [Cichorium endivia]|nr:hypothetical protein L1887_46261 [Cichorium endivia]